MVGAFHDDGLIGFALVEARAYGSYKQYFNLGYLMVSHGFRGQGIGTMLFKAACEKAVCLGAQKLYISAHSSMEAIGFYEKLNCVGAEEIIEELMDDPFDWQLEYALAPSPTT